MALQFSRAIEHMEVWSASRDGFSFVITHGSRAGHGFRGQPGYVASWRPLDQSRGAIKIGGSPFTTFAKAEDACNIMLKILTRADQNPACSPP
jgi:hypothetical protein